MEISPSRGVKDTFELAGGRDGKWDHQPPTPTTQHKRHAPSTMGWGRTVVPLSNPKSSNHIGSTNCHDDRANDGSCTKHTKTPHTHTHTPALTHTRARYRKLGNTCRKEAIPWHKILLRSYEQRSAPPFFGDAYYLWRRNRAGCFWWQSRLHVHNSGQHSCPNKADLVELATPNHLRRQEKLFLALLIEDSLLLVTRNTHRVTYSHTPAPTHTRASWWKAVIPECKQTKISTLPEWTSRVSKIMLSPQICHCTVDVLDYAAFMPITWQLCWTHSWMLRCDFIHFTSKLANSGGLVTENAYTL